MKKYNNTILALGIVGAFFVASPAYSAPEKGKDKNIHWQTISRMPAPANTIDFTHSLDGKYAYYLTKDSKVLVYDRKGRLQGSVPVAKGVASIEITPYGEQLYLLDKQKNALSTLSLELVMNINTKNAPYKGKIDAPIEIVLFTDFE